MTVGSNVLHGVDAQISIKEKGSTAYNFGGRITSYDKTGFERNVEYKPCQGFYFESRKPITPGRVSFDVLLDVDTTNSALTFSDIIGSYSLYSGSVRKNELSEKYTNYKVSVEFINYVGTYGTLGTNDEAYKEVFYNARGLSFDRKVDSRGNLTGTMVFVVSPFNSNGSSNYVEFEKIIGAVAGSYTGLETAKDTEMGY